MRVAIFFVYMCILLLKGNENSLARTYQDNVSYVHSSGTALQSTDYIMAGDRDCSVFRDTRPVMENEYMISEEVEDEDPNDYFTPKVKLLARSREPYDYQRSLRYLRSYFKAPPFFLDQQSCKYLTQRALRI